MTSKFLSSWKVNFDVGRERKKQFFVPRWKNNEQKLYVLTAFSFKKKIFTKFAFFKKKSKEVEKEVEKSWKKLQVFLFVYALILFVSIFNVNKLFFSKII